MTTDHAKEIRSNEGEAPERIWIDTQEDTPELQFFFTASTEGFVQYVRADLLTTARQEERKAVQEASFKELCVDCAEGDQPAYDKQARWYYHSEGKHEVGCSASKLRIVAALEASTSEGRSCDE